MNIRQWEVWKSRPVGFERDHWFVIISGQERCHEPKQIAVDGLACFSYRGSQRKSEVKLNSADGFPQPTLCQCVFIYSLAKSGLHDCVGSVTWERQQQIKKTITEVFRLEPS